MTESAGITPGLTDNDFLRISRLVYQHCGINLQSGKEALVRSRLARRLQRLGIENFKSYIAYVESAESHDELRAMIDALTTNKTSFFREEQHFELLRTQILPGLQGGGRALRFWCAGCATGEEPYTLAMILSEHLVADARSDCRILATDISSRALDEARKGVYDAERVGDIPQPYLRQYFRVEKTGKPPAYVVSDSLRTMVRFASLNLIGPWPMSGQFDVIFCRNVMIYFDLHTRKRLAERFSRILRSGGYLFVGHSESIMQCGLPFRYVQPAVYLKNDE